MKQFIVSAVVLLSALSAGVASAQVYSYYPTTGSSCVTLTRDLAVGSRGSDVTSLQRFLLNQNYQGSGSWMVTGYFGVATQAAVRNFQQSHGLAVSGAADASTRAAIANCGAPSNVNTNYNYNYNYNNNPYLYPSTPVNPVYPTYPPFNVHPGYNAVTLTALSASSAIAGSAVTITGTGFDYSNNTVYIGSMPISNIASFSGTSLTFTVPAYLSGSQLVYVANTRGTSNSLALTVIPGSNTCTYPYSGSCGCSYGYNTNCTNGMPTITYLSPTSGAVSSSVTVFGSGFSTSGNTVHFGQGIITNLGSADGRSVSFIVPTQLTGYGTATVGLGTYNVSVTNAAGYTSNTLPYTVTSLGSTNSPSIVGVTGPTSLGVNVSGTWTLQVNNFNNTYLTTTVRWGDENNYGAMGPQTTSIQGQQTLTFTHSYAQPGTYTVTFTVANIYGQQNVATATVTVSGSGSTQVSLSYLSPTSGRPGTQITLNGNGFTTYDNTVHFGIGGTQHLPSYNGTTIYFTIPQYVSPCDVITSGNYCAMYAQQVTPGTYQVSVTNGSGQTGQQTFTVTQ
ncbi:MAG: IPT/TIG domain-containing protein [Candidatus Paceibacterota bacterium]